MLVVLFVGFRVKTTKRETTRAEIPVMVSLQLHLSCEDYLYKKIIK